MNGPDPTHAGPLADTQLDRWLAEVRRNRMGSYREIGIPALREEKAARDAARPPGPVVATFEDLSTPSGLACRIYHSSLQPRPTILYLHGGGFATGGIRSHDGVCRHLAIAADATVVAVEYRLAPEHPAPASIDDTVETARWLTSLRLGGQRFSGIALAGDSAGGTLAVLGAVRLVAQGIVPNGLLMVYPNADMTLHHGSVVSEGHGWGLESEDLHWFIEQWVPDARLRANAAVSPLSADLRGLPPTLLATVLHDPLRDEGRALAARLKEAGVSVEHVEYDDLIHGFLGLAHISPAAHGASAELFSRFGRMLRRRHAGSRSDAQRVVGSTALDLASE